MTEYSPRRRTALVFAGTGTAGAYQAGVLKALDESGVKIDVVVGSGVGALTATFAAVGGGQRLYGSGGFWQEVRARHLHRPRFALRAGSVLAGMAFAVFLLPVVLAILAGIFVVPVLIVDVIAPGFASRVLAAIDATPDALRGLYLSALAVPSFFVSLLVAIGAGGALLRDRRRAAERLEHLFDTRRAQRRALDRLWEVAHGAIATRRPTAEVDIGRRVAALVADNLGQPGFRELILRVADLESGRPVSFFILDASAREAFTSARRAAEGEVPRVVDVRLPGQEGFLADALLAGLGAPLLTPLRRIVFPRGGPFAGATHRLTDPLVTTGCGLADALATGAEQIILVTASPTRPITWTQRRGPTAALEAVLAAREHAELESELRETERLNRIIETVGHPGADGRRTWQDPATGRVFRSVDVYVVRPQRRMVGPLAFDGVRDASDVPETVGDLVDHGYQDAHRLFLGPVVGASAPSSPSARAAGERRITL